MLDGSSPLTEIEEMKCSLPHPIVFVYRGYLVHDTSEDHRITQLYRACGFDPNSSGLARHFKLPLIDDLLCKHRPLECLWNLNKILGLQVRSPITRRHSISTLAEFTMKQTRGERQGRPISIHATTNHGLNRSVRDWMG